MPNPLEIILREIVAGMPGVRIAALVGTDRTPIAQVSRDDRFLAEHLAAMAASLVGLGATASTTFACGELAQVVVRGTSGYLLLMAVGQGATLAMVAGSDSELGYLRHEIRVQVERLALALSVPSR